MSGNPNDDNKFSSDHLPAIGLDWIVSFFFLFKYKKNINNKSKSLIKKRGWENNNNNNNICQVQRVLSWRYPGFACDTNIPSSVEQIDCGVDYQT